MEMLEAIKTALAIFIVTGTVGWSVNFIRKRVAALMEAVESQGAVVAAMKDATSRHYEEDRALFTALNAKFDVMEQKLDDHYPNNLIDEKFKFVNSRIDNLRDHIDVAKRDIVSHVDVSTAEVLKELKNRREG